MTKTNKLTEVYRKADYAVRAVDNARQFVNYAGPLWYHAIGLFNAFYAINEELATRTQNDRDANLVAAVKAWRSANSKTIRSFFGSARNTATHQGEIVTENFIEWESDFLNDTEYPVPRATVTVKGSTIHRMLGSDFLDLCQSALEFMRDGIIAINDDYRSRGGIDHLLPNKSYDDLF